MIEFSLLQLKYSGTIWWDNRRFLQAPIPLTTGVFKDPYVKDEQHVYSNDVYVLASQCKNGQIEWKEGPYDCETDCGDSYPQTDEYGDIKDHLIAFLWGSENVYGSWDFTVRRYGICRVGGYDTGDWKIGMLIEFPGWVQKYHSHIEHPYNYGTNK